MIKSVACQTGYAYDCIAHPMPLLCLILLSLAVNVSNYSVTKYIVLDKCACLSGCFDTSCKLQSNPCKQQVQLLL